MKPLSRTTLAVVAAFLFSVSATQADIIWSWSFDETSYVVGPTDDILIQATLFNDASSTGSIHGIGGGAVALARRSKTS
jgi:hypothetical protein